MAKHTHHLNPCCFSSLCMWNEKTNSVLIFLRFKVWTPVKKKHFGCGGWARLQICIRLMRSTPIHPLQSLFPFLRPFREKSKLVVKSVAETSSYRIWGPDFFPPAPFSHTARLLAADQTLDRTVTMEMSRKKTSISAAACWIREGDHPKQNWSPAHRWRRGAAANQRAQSDDWRLSQPPTANQRAP